VSERWAYARHKGKKWLADVLEDVREHIMALPPAVVASRALDGCARAGRVAAGSGMRGLARSNTVLSAASTRARTWTEKVLRPRASEDTLPTVHPNGEPIASPPMTPRASEMTATSMPFAVPPGSPVSEKNSGVPGVGASPGSPSSPTDVTAPTMNAATRSRFASLVRAAVLMRRGPAAVMLGAAARARTASGDATRDARGGRMRASRVAALTPRLRSLEPTQDLAAHQALVRHLQFSPDGRFLATSSWDRTSVIFRVGVSVHLQSPSVGLMAA
jgi:hypothetical protein